MQALSPAGLADSHDLLILESASPKRPIGDKSNPSERGLSHISDGSSTSTLAIAKGYTRRPPELPEKLHRLSAVVDRGAPDRRSASSVACRPPSMGGRPRRGEVCAPRSAEAAAGANRRRNSGRKQAPSHGGLTRPAKARPGATAPRQVRGIRSGWPDRTSASLRCSGRWCS